MDEEYKNLLVELLKPIEKDYYQWGSYTHGHLGTNGKGLLPWYYLKYDTRLGEEVYNKHFAKYETSEGEENNNFFSNYRYFDIDLFNSFEKIKELSKNNIQKIVTEIKKIVEKNKDKIEVIFNDEETACRFAFGNIIGISPINQDLLNKIMEFIQN